MRISPNVMNWLAIAICALFYFLATAECRADESPAALRAHAAQLEVKHDLPPGLLQAICEQESRWANVAGRHGEIGVCQIKPDTVRMICPDCHQNAKRTFFKFGSRGDTVLRLQAELVHIGLYAGALDGIFGPATHAAVVEFQQRVGLRQDGVVGPQTWQAIFQDEPFPGTTIAAALWSPRDNIEWAARLLVWLRDNVSPEPLIMMAAYNGGPANPVVRYMLQTQKRLPAAI